MPSKSMCHGHWPTVPSQLPSELAIGCGYEGNDHNELQSDFAPLCGAAPMCFWPIITVYEKTRWSCFLNE